MGKVLVLVLLAACALPLLLLAAFLAVLGGGATWSSHPAVPWSTWAQIGVLPACRADPAPAVAAVLIGALPGPEGSARWRRGASRTCALGLAMASSERDQHRLEVLTMALRASPGLGERRARFLDFVASAMGTPYVWGGAGPGGYDCSGLVYDAAHHVDLNPPRVAQAQFDAGRFASTPNGEPGDLIFFGGAPRSIGHVGVVVDATHMVDAPHQGAVVRLEDDRWPGIQGVRAIEGMDR